MSMRESSKYLGQEGDRIFSILHEPVAPNGRGVVLCAPLGEEMLWSRRVLVTFARELAGRGYAVMRFDYRGEGDSERWFEDSSVTTRLEDISLATASLKQQLPGAGGITLVGLRFGAALAAAATAGCPDVRRLVLWDPVVNGADYMQSVLRLNLMYQMALHRKVVENRDQLVDRLANGQTINVEGYQLSMALYEEACTLNLETTLDRFDGPVQFLSILQRAGTPRPELVPLSSKRPQWTLCSVVEEPFWREIKTFYQRAEQLFDATIHWLGAQE